MYMCERVCVLGEEAVEMIHPDSQQPGCREKDPPSIVGNMRIFIS